MKKILVLFFIALLLVGCSPKQLSSSSATVLFKANGLKFYDKGFITKYTDKVNLTIFSFGKIVLSLDVYEDRVCESTFKCLHAKEFNTKYLSSEYRDDFLYKLLLQDSINFKDKNNGIRIKLIKTKG